MDHSLEELRSQIDEIDNQLLALLEQRMQTVSAIGALKHDLGLPALDEARFHALVARLCSRSSLDSSFISDLYNVIHSESLKHE